MGIPYYFYTLYKKYANDKLMIDERDIPNVDHLFFDYNSMIHPCAHKVLKEANSNQDDIENRIVQECGRYMQYVLDIVKPRNVFVMIDGVAPRAKMNQQRERRYKSMFFKTLYKNDQMNWDTNKITPGTNFMQKIQDELYTFAKRWSDINFVISGSDECGEGEHKMMHYIDSHCQTGTIMIYGLDADLIMLGLLISKNKNITLLRDNNFNEKLPEIQKTFTYLNIKVLKQCICREIQTMANLDLDETRIVQDYIFLCFLLGNDFLEHLPSLIIKENGVNVLTKVYTNILIERKDYLVNNPLETTLSARINLKFLEDLFGRLSKSEDYFFAHVYSVYRQKSVYKDIVVEEVYDSMLFYQDDCIKYNIPGYKKRYYSYYGITDINEVCKDYINGLYWVLGYYNKHEHNNWDWFYKHHATPFVSDLWMYLAKFDKDRVYEIETSKPCTPIEQLFMVLPKQSLLKILEEDASTLYNRVKRVFRTSNSKELKRYYPNSICIDMVHREYLWQAKIFFEHFDKQFLSIFF
jgi:5'-3' exonuclease